MAKPTTTSPERQALAAAHQELAAAQREHAEIEAAYEEARRAWGRAQSDADDIRSHIKSLEQTRAYGVDQLIAEKNTKIASAVAAHRVASDAVSPFTVKKDAAQARLAPAQTAIINAEIRIAQC